MCLLGTTPEELARSICGFQQMLLHGDVALEQCAIVVLSGPSSGTIHLKVHADHVLCQGGLQGGSNLDFENNEENTT